VCSVRNKKSEGEVTLKLAYTLLLLLLIMIMIIMTVEITRKVTTYCN